MSKRIGLKLLLSLVCVFALGLAAFFGYHAYALSTEKQVGGSGYLEYEEQETPTITYDPTDATFIAPDVTQGFTATTVGNTTTYTRDNETYVVTTTTSGSTTTNSCTFTNGSRVTTFTTEDINGTDVTLTALNVTGGETAGSMGSYSYIDIVIPDYIAVIGDGSNAIVGSSSPYRLTLGSGVMAINTSALAGSGVIEVVFTGDKFTTIMEYAFAESLLHQIHLPEGLVSIGPEAFLGTQLLTSINFPTTLTSIGPVAFQDSGLENIAIHTAYRNWGIYEGPTTSSTQMLDLIQWFNKNDFNTILTLLTNGAAEGYVGYWLRYA